MEDVRIIAPPALPEGIRSLWFRLKTAGGQPFLVGGAVIDILRGHAPKDWDIEVYGLDLGVLERMLSDLHPEVVGRSFGVLKLRVDGLDVDINVPRLERRMGPGHRDFDVTVDPHLSIREAALRRDFTVNALALDVLTGECHNPFGGLQDLENGTLRVVSAETFTEDPLRVLRGAQLLARKLNRVHSNDWWLFRSLSGEFSSLPKERVFAEFGKLLLKAERPSVGFEFLRDAGWLTHFPEINELIGCPQHPEWHPEGDVWRHSMLCVDAAAQIRDTLPDEGMRLAVMFGALLHDVGKPEYTITERMIHHQDPRAVAAAASAKRPLEQMLLTAHGHDTGGVEPAGRFLARISDDKTLTKRVKALVGLHMQPYNLVAGSAGDGAWNRLHRKLTEASLDLTVLGRICQCDACATGSGRSLRGGSPDWEHETSRVAFAHADRIRDLPTSVSPKVTGGMLLARGVKPGPLLGGLLRRALELQDTNPTLTAEDLLTQIGCP